MNLPGFTPGEEAQNAVVAVMYFVAIAAVIGVVVVSLGIPGSFSGQSGGGGDGNPVAANGSVEQTQTQSQPQGQRQTKDSGWVTVGSSSDSGRNGGSSNAATATQRISEDQVQLNALRGVMQNSSRVQLVSADIRHNEMYVRYTQDNMSQYEVRSGMGTVAGAFFGMVPAGADLQAIHGRLIDKNGKVAYTFTVKRKLAIQYNNGAITKQELRQRLLEALKPANQTSMMTS